MNLLLKAMEEAQKSPDEQSKHGCVIANDFGDVLGKGFNTLPRDVDWHDLPKLRPPEGGDFEDPDYKYPWMFHAELSALLDARIIGGRKFTAFITSQPCNPCLYSLWQWGIYRLVMLDNNRTTRSKLLSPKTQVWFDRFIAKTGIELIYVPRDQVETFELPPQPQLVCKANASIPICRTLRQ